MWAYAAYVVIGLMAGFLSAIFGIGGGVILVPTLILVLAVPAKAATATSLAYIVPIALYGTVRQWYMGQDIRWLLALLAVPLGLIGAELGSRVKQYMSNAQVQILFGLLLIGLGIYLGLRGRAEFNSQRLAAAGRPSTEAPAQRPPTVVP
jgi:uncharacterized membrane protein YfcA